MERPYGQIRFLALCALLLGLASLSPELCAQSGGGQTAMLKDFKLPQYNEKSGQLEFILYGNEADALGVIIHFRGALADIIKKEAKVDDVKDLRKLKTLYDINSSNAEVVDFWKDKTYSNLLIQTSEAEYDRSTKIIKGNEKIHVRSLFLDLDGVGFIADQDAQTLQIKKNVKVVYRGELHDKEKKKKADQEAEKKRATKEKTADKAAKK